MTYNSIHNAVTIINSGSVFLCTIVNIPQSKMLPTCKVE